MITGIETNIPVIICTLVASIGILLTLFKHNKELSPLYIGISGIGSGIALLSLIPNLLPDWLKYIALITLVTAFFIAPKNWNIQWKKQSAQGAYIILIALVLHTFLLINETMLTSIMAIIGLVFYFIGLNKFQSGLDLIGRSGISKLKIAIILGIVGAVFNLIPLIGGIVATLLAIIAFILEFIGYGALRNSSSVGTEGQNGAGMLRNSMIVLLVAALVSFLSDTFAGVITIAALFMIFSGWTQLLFGVNEELEIDNPTIILS